MLRRAILLSFALLVLACPRAARAQTIDDLKKMYEDIQPDVRDFWTLMNDVKEEERHLVDLMTRAREAEEEAARDPADTLARKHADDLSHAAQQWSQRRQKNMQAFSKRLDEFRKKVKAVEDTLDSYQRDHQGDEGPWVLKLRFFTDLGRFFEVRDDAAHLFETHPDDRNVRFAYAQTLMVVPVPQNQALLVRAPRFDKALEVLAPLAKAEPKTPEVQLLYGVAACAMDKNAEAAAAFDSIGAITSVWPPVRIVIGNSQDPEEAYVAWRETAAGLAKNPDDVTLRRRRGELELSVGADDRAIADAELCKKTKPDDLEVNKLLARCYSRSKRLEEAAPLYETMLGEMDKDEELRGEYALFLFRTNKIQECFEQLFKIKDATKFNPHLLSLLGSMVDEIQKKTPEEPHIELVLMKVRADKGELTQIWDIIAKAQARLPDEPIGRFVLAETLMCVPIPHSNDPRRQIAPRPPRFAKVYELLAPLVKSDPKNKEVLLLHGVAACAIGKDAEAKAELDAVASVDSIRPVIRQLLGSAQRPHQLFERWHELCGLAEHPDDAALHAKRAQLLFEVDAGPLAIRDAELAAKAKPDDAAIKTTLARAYFAGNHYDKALQALGRVDIAAVSSDVISLYAASLYDSNRMADFKTLWESTDKATLLKDLPGLHSMLRVPGKVVENLAGYWEAEEKARAEDAKKDDLPRVLFETDKGKIVLELFEDTAPNTVSNFIWLVQNGFYDGIKFHRVITGFMAQGGDPTGTGAGGCGYNIKDELKGNPRLHWRGTLSMANTGQPSSGNSQFFLCFTPTPHLNPAQGQGRWTGHTVFGRILEGQEVADSLERDDAIVKASILRKRDHEYKPETIPVMGAVPWKPPTKKE